jgi:hypothetical protein
MPQNTDQKDIDVKSESYINAIRKFLVSCKVSLVLGVSKIFKQMGDPESDKTKIISEEEEKDKFNHITLYRYEKYTRQRVKDKWTLSKIFYSKTIIEEYESYFEKLVSTPYNFMSEEEYNRLVQNNFKGLSR